MQVRCFTCGNVVSPLWIHFDTLLDKIRMPSNATDEQLLNNPNRRRLEAYFLLDCCRMRSLTHINKHDQHDLYYDKSTLLHTVFPKRKDEAAEKKTAGTTSTDILLATAPNLARAVRYDSARKFHLAPASPTLGNFLRQLLLDDCWISAIVPTDNDITSSVGNRCDNVDVIRLTLQQLPLTPPVPEKDIASPHALYQHYRDFSDRYYAYLHCMNTSLFQIAFATTKHVHIYRQDTQAVDLDMTHQAVPCVMVEPSVHAAIPIATLRQALHSRDTITPELKMTHLSLQPVCAIWNKTFTLFSQVKFEMTPDTAAIEAHRVALRKQYGEGGDKPLSAEQAEALEVALAASATEYEPLLRLRDQCDFTLRMTASYYSYEFAWKMVFATVHERLTYFLQEVLPHKPIQPYERSYDRGEYVIPIGDGDFLREFERPVHATLSHPTHKYGYLLSNFVLEEYVDGPTRVLKSVLVIDHVDRPTADWHLTTLVAETTADDVRALVHDAVRLLLEKYQTMYKNLVYC